MFDLPPTDAEQITCMAHAIYHESRGEPLFGQVLVAHVIRARAEDWRWPSSYCEVIEQPNQFEFYIGFYPPMIDRGAMSEAYRIASAVHEAESLSYSPCILNFHTTWVEPVWDFSQLRVVTKVGDHIFYEDQRCREWYFPDDHPM